MRFKLATMGAVTLALGAGSVHADSVTNSLIFGDGNSNGSFTITQASGVELGLRAKLRHNAIGQPENTFNQVGTSNVYAFEGGVAPTQSFPTGVWSFEWSINTNFDGSSGLNLDDLTYELSLSGTNVGGTVTFDPINDDTDNNGSPYWDHAIGTNGTGNGDGVVAVDEADYVDLIDNNNLAQNSWKAVWFFPNYNPEVEGIYNITLSASSSTGEVASTSIVVTSTPSPSAMGLGLIGGLGLIARRRRSNRSDA